jgi:hypothetical protein
MADNDQDLETIFDQLSARFDLPVAEINGKKIAQGSVYVVEFSKEREVDRLLYIDRVASADIYDTQIEKSLNYSTLVSYAHCQSEFLNSQPSGLSHELAKTMKENISGADRAVYNISLDDFSEIRDFLTVHINHF